MNRLLIVLFLAVGLIAAAVLLRPAKKPVTTTVVGNPAANQNTAFSTNESITAPPLNVLGGAGSGSAGNVTTNASSSSATNTGAPESLVVTPMEDFFNRITKKPFAIYITPAASPVQPERFTGYHTGADAETAATEGIMDIPIYAIAAGTVVYAGRVNGYGGVIMIRSTVGTETVTALYGHVRIFSFTVAKGDRVKPGGRIAILGTGYSSETDGERKHLHLGIIKGTVISYKGYVPTQNALSAWHDPAVWLRDHGAGS